jgi:hypothetical protein
MTSVRNFLIQAKAVLRTAISQGQKVTLVIGNESAGNEYLHIWMQSYR